MAAASASDSEGLGDIGGGDLDVQELVRMAHSGELPPHLATFRRELLEECERHAASTDDHELRIVLRVRSSRSVSRFDPDAEIQVALYKSTVSTSVGSKLKEYLRPRARGRAI